MIHKIFRIKVGSILKQIKKKNLSLEKWKHKDIWFKTRYNSKNCRKYQGKWNTLVHSSSAFSDCQRFLLTKSILFFKIITRHRLNTPTSSSTVIESENSVKQKPIKHLQQYKKKMLPLNIGTLSYSTTIFGFRLFKSWEMSPVGKIIHQYIKSNLLLRLLYLKHLNTKKHSILALKRVR